MKLHDMTSPWGFLRIHILLAVLIFVLALLSGSYLGHAANHYIRADAAGTATGADWTNAWTSWPAILVRGDTYYIADGDYERTVESTWRFDDAESGELYITLKKATVAEHGTETGWDNAYGDGQAVFDYGITFNTAYWIWDGVSASDPSDSSTYGFKVKRLTGSSTSTTMCIGVPIQGYSSSDPHHVTIQYTAMVCPGGDVYEAKQQCFYSMSESGTHDVTVAHCYLAEGQVNMLIRGWYEGCVIEYNYFAENHGTTWGAYHGEQISPGGAYGYSCEDVILRNNTFVDSKPYVIGAHTNNNDGWLIYNNLVLGGTGASIWGTADSGHDDVVKNWHVHHNTHIGWTGASAAVLVGNLTDGSNKTYVYNNLFIDCSLMYMDNSSWADSTLVHDHNAYYNTTHTTEVNEITGSTAPVMSDSEPYDLDLTSSINGVAQDSLTGGLDTLRTADYDDSTLNDPPDVGVYEFNSGDEAGGSGVSTYYVRKTGNDTTGDGSLALPYLTIAKATSVADSGDVIDIGAGTWQEEIAYPNSHITVVGAGASTIISGHKQMTGWTVPSAGGAATDTSWIAASADDGSWSEFDRTYTTNGTVINIGERFTDKFFWGFFKHRLVKTVIDNADSMKFRIYNTLDNTGARDVNLSLQNTARVTAPTDTTTYKAARADTLTVGITIATSPSLNTFIAWNISSWIDSIKALVDYGDTNYVGIHLHQDVDLSNRAIGVRAFDSDSTHQYPHVITYYTTSGGDTTLAHRVLTGDEADAISVFIGGALGVAVDSADVNETGEYYISADNKLYLPKGDTTSVWISALGFGINTDGQPGSIVSNLTIRGFNRGGVLFDDAGFTMSNVLMDSLRMFVNVDGTSATFDHLTMIGGLFGTDSLVIKSSPITNSIVDSVAVVDTTDGYAGSYNNWHDSDDQPAGTGDITTDLELDSAGIPTVATWAANGDYFGYAYYAAGTVTITAPDSTGVYDYGDSVYIKWTDTGIDSLYLYYSLTGDYFTIIDTVAVSADSLLWVVPRQHSETMTIYAVSTVSALVNDTSDEFTVNADYPDSAIVAINDGYVRNLDATYATARNTDSDLYADDNYMFVGRTTGYRVRRAFASFPLVVLGDTLRIAMLSSNDYSNAAAPSGNEYVGFYSSQWNGYEPYLSINYDENQIALACTLWVYHAGNYSTTDFNVYLLEATYGDEIDVDDFNNFSGWASSGAYTGTVLNETWNTDGWVNGRMAIVFNTAGVRVVNGLSAVATDTEDLDAYGKGTYDAVTPKQPYGGLGGYNN